MKEVTSILLVEATSQFEDEGADEETLRSCIESDLSDHGYSINQCTLLDSNTGEKLAQLQRVKDAELNYQLELAKLEKLL